MVVKKSEYQNQFKSSTITKNQSIYLENLTFRHVRRDREFLHTPIVWQNQNSEDTVSSEDETNDDLNNCLPTSMAITKIKQKDDEPHYQSLAEILDESKAKSIALRQKRTLIHTNNMSEVLGKISLIDDDHDSGQQQKSVSKVCDIEDSEKLKGDTCKSKQFEHTTEKESNACSVEDKQTERKLKSRSNLRRKGNQRKNSEKSPSASRLGEPKHCSKAQNYGSQDVPPLLISQRPKRPDRQKRIPSAKSKSQPVSHFQERPPFVVYGAGDIEDTFTNHRTHNVRSTADVYGAALKAKVRREEEKRRQMERQKRLTQSTNDILERLASATPRDMIDYRSEYQKQFHGYEPREYEKCYTSRAVIPHSAPIRAVHRGSSLIVHVD